MTKSIKIKIILSSLFILLPSAAGLLMWDKFVKQTFFDFGLGQKYLIIFGIPIFLLIIHLSCVFLTLADKKNKFQSKKAMGMVFWICPCISVCSSCVAYGAISGAEFNINMIIALSISIMFIIIGNYLPKCRQNKTLGIKTKQTLESEENWNATHRFSGKVWVVCGLLTFISAFLPKKFSLVPMIFIAPAAVIIPIIYSYAYSRKYPAKEIKTYTDESEKKRITNIITAIIVTVIFIFSGVLMFTGNINYEYGDNFFIVKATYWSDMTVNYDEIESIEFHETDNAGTRVYGFGSARLQMGKFTNNEYGNYTRFSYVACPANVELTVNGETLILNGKNITETKAIYDALSDKMI